MSQTMPTTHHDPRAVEPVFVLLDGQIGWRASHTVQLHLGESVQLESLTAGGGERLDAPGGSFGGLTSPLGVAFDGDRLLVSDTTHNVVYCWRITGDDPPSILSTIGDAGDIAGSAPDDDCIPATDGRVSPRGLNQPRGLAVTPGRDLCIADTGNKRVLVFSLPTLALLGALRPPGGIDWEPWDVVSGHDGSIYVADRMNSRIHRWNPRRVYDGRYRGTGMSGEDARLHRPFRIVTGVDGSLYVADEDLPFVTVLDRQGRTVERIAAVPDLIRNPRLLGVTEPGDRLYVVSSRSELVSIIDREGRVLGTIPRPVQATDLQVDGSIPIVPGSLVLEVDDARHYVRLLNDGSDARADREIERVALAAVLEDRLGGPALTRDDAGVLWFVQKNGARPGEATKNEGKRCRPDPWMLSDIQAKNVSLGGRLIVNNLVTELMVMAPQMVASFSSYGYYMTVPIDSQIHRCPWHRIAVEMDVPEGTSVTIDTVTADVVRATEEILQLDADRWARGIPNAGDFLIASDPGRYLWLRMTLRGPATSTPRVRSIRIYAPRRSSLGMLPAVFQQDETSRDFLDRYLSIFDTSFAEIETTIGGLARYLDPSGVPDDWLPWLAGWMDLAIDGAWPLERQRDVLKDLPWLYARRGTVGGLRRLIRLYTGAPEPWPSVVEHFRFRRWEQRRSWQAPKEQVPTPPGIGRRFVAGDALDPEAPGAGAHAFTVLVPERAIAGDEQIAALLRVVEAWRPAHTAFAICLVSPRMRVGYQATIGVDSVVGSWSGTVLDRDSSLDYSILGSPVPGHPFEPTIGNVRVAGSSRLD